LITSQEACLTAAAASSSTWPPSGVSAPPPGAASPASPPSSAPPPGETSSGTPPSGVPLSRGSALVVRSWAEPAKAAVGQQVRIVSEIHNTGTELLRGVRVSVGHDPQLRPTMATEGFRREDHQVIWLIDQIQPGNRATIQVQYECLQPREKICTRTQAATLQGAQAGAEACLSVEGAAAEAGLRGPDLFLTVTPLKDPATVGEQVTYRITVVNQGQKPDFQVVLALNLPKQLLPNRIGTSGPAPCEIQGQVVRFAPVGQIRPGETLTYRIVALALSPGELEVAAQVQSQTLPQPKTAVQKTRIHPKGG